MLTLARLPLTPRVGYVLGFAACAGLIGFALYLQHYQYQNPCPLCILQRITYMVLAALFLVAALHGPGRAGAVVHGVLQCAAALTGAAIAARHVWLQHLPRDQVPECGPGLAYLLDRFPLMRALEKILTGSGECAETGWTFLGLSIAGWSLLCFMAIGAFAILLAARGARARR